MANRGRRKEDRELVTAYEQRDVAAATLASALDALQDLVRHVMREGGYMRPQDQLALGQARALLVAHGRSVEP